MALLRPCSPSPAPRAPMRLSVIAVGMLVLAVGCVIGWMRRGEDRAANPAEVVDPTIFPAATEPGAAEFPSTPSELAAEEQNRLPPNAGEATSTQQQTLPSTANPPSPSQLPAASAYSHALVAYLASADLSPGAFTSQHAQLWREGLSKLVQEGDRALPAIREFLSRNVDLDFAAAHAAELSGTPSLRAGLLDAIRQIGGPEAINLALEVMQITQRPDEIARLARDLEVLAPQQYREAAVSAARAGLARGSMPAGPDPAAGPLDSGPLFEVLQKFGGPEVTPDLEQAARRWNYYAPMVLAALPEGGGVESLARLAQGEDPAYATSSPFALRMLAEISPQDPAASRALLEQAARNEIPNAAWVGIAAALGGEQSRYSQKYLNPSDPATMGDDLKTYHIKANNQNFVSVNVARNWTPQQLQSQLQLVEQLRAANPTASRMLDPVRLLLSARLGR